MPNNPITSHLIETFKRGNSRFYVDPDCPQITVPGVTSVINMLPKPFLQHWAAKMAAECAIEDFEFIERMVSRGDKSAAVDHVKGAATRYTRTRAAVGSKAHDLFERMIRGEAPTRVEPDLEPYRRHFAEFLDVVRPELVSAEDVMWSDMHAYAGSSDAIIRVKLTGDNVVSPLGDDVTMIVDWKTSKDSYPDVALQLAAYAHADRLIRPDGSDEDMPEIEAGAVLHITPDGWVFKLVNISDEVFAVFLALRQVFEWDRTGQKSVFGKPVAQHAGALVTGTQRRAK